MSSLDFTSSHSPAQLRFARGSVGLVLIMTSLTVFLLLPLLTGLVRTAYSQWMVLRAGALLDETLPSASLCLDPDRLAEGELALDSAAVDTLVRTRLATTLPSLLTGRLEIVSITTSWMSIPGFDDHWLGDRQPSQIPVVSCTIRLIPLAGDPFLMTRSVKLLQTPD
ncbi:MAG: hypothetical protein EOM08_01490 [Clostridia bacterium]|nr:hypothetical protein [Clostridia bacterium]NCC75089.1 hypothetical protein [Clostridia bacterium]